MSQRPGGLRRWMLCAVLAVGVGGCAGLSDVLRGNPNFVEVPAAPSAEPGASPVVGSADGAPADAGRSLVTPVEGGAGIGLVAGADALVVAQQASSGELAAGNDEIEEYDPWEPFNEKMFEFNRALDRWVIKPAAKWYNSIVPDRVQEMVGNGFDNLRVVPRFVNSLLQAKLGGAGRELARFAINSTLGIGGLFDIAKQEFGIRKSNEDAGQTLGVWGMGPGPFLMLPFLPPLTVRDGIGFAADTVMDPIGYLVPSFWVRGAMKAGDTINDRSQNLDLFQSFEETTVEFYSALRNAYLQRRQKLIRE